MRIDEAKMLRPEQVLQNIRRAIANKTSFSLVRLASGEAFTLAHNVLLPVSRIPWWVDYAGVRLPNEAARRDLIDAVVRADIVGLSPDHKRWECAPLLEKAFTHYHLNPPNITSATINWHLHADASLYRTIAGTPTILIGRRANEAAPHLRKKGIHLIKTYNLEGYTDLPRLQRELKEAPNFGVALVAAGIPATILCPRLARSHSCVALDYGHVINDLIAPGFNIHVLDEERERWKREIGYNKSRFGKR